MTELKSNPHGGPNRGQGRKSKPPEAKYRHRMISLPPALDDRLIKWSIETGREISPLIQTLLTQYFERTER